MVSPCQAICQVETKPVFDHWCDTISEIGARYIQENLTHILEPLLICKPFLSQLPTVWECTIYTALQLVQICFVSEGEVICLRSVCAFRRSPIAVWSSCPLAATHTDNSFCVGNPRNCVAFDSIAGSASVKPNALSFFTYEIHVNLGCC